MKIHRNFVWNKEDLHIRIFKSTPRFSNYCIRIFK